VRSKFHALVLLAIVFLIVAPVLAVKPAGNLASAEKVPWNLSAEVMKVPPYGSRDIPGSDEASKLIVNQPNGNVEVVMTGVMKGLHPNTVYTVYLSRGYALTFERWSLAGDWKLEFDFKGNPYRHDMWITAETDTTFSGTGAYPEGGPYTITWIVTGTKGGNGVSITMQIDYDGSTYLVDAIGTIDSDDGSMSGTWESNVGQSGTWKSIAGEATFQGIVGKGWPGLFTGTIQPFTFTTDEYGSASWHLNLRDNDFPGPGTYTLSVWINEAGGTMLISDNFPVVVVVND